MSDLYMADIGFHDDTVIYRLVPVEVGRYQGYNARGVAEALSSFGAQNVLVDSAPEFHDMLRALGFHVIKGSIPVDKERRP